MARSLGFGSIPSYYIALFRLAFASAPSLQLNLAWYNNSPVHSAKGTPSPINGLWLLVSTWFQTPLPGFFSPFPLGTCSLSVTREYLALRDGPRGFRQDFTCLAVLRIPYWVYNISFTGLSPTMVKLPNLFNYIINLWLVMYGPTTPTRKLVWALSFSLATTREIDFSFSSSGY